MMPTSFSSSAALRLPVFLFFFSILCPSSIEALSCLVVRPGFGLVSEECPTRAIGCRIKVDRDSIQWYEYSRLYDRNQLACVLPGEYTHVAGCVRKKAGSVRCWCGGRDGCNDPETSRALYHAFEKGGNLAVQQLLAGRQRWQDSFTQGPKEDTPQKPPQTEGIATKKVKTGKISEVTQKRVAPTTTTSATTTEKPTRRATPLKVTKGMSTSSTTSTMHITSTTATTPTQHRHRVTGKVHVKGKVHKSPIVDKRIVAELLPTDPPATTLKAYRLAEGDGDRHQHKHHHKHHKVMTTTSTSRTTTTTTPSYYEEAKRRISEEMREEDFRLNLILEDEEKEALMDNEEDEPGDETTPQNSRERARADAEKRRKEAERKAKQGNEEEVEEVEEEDEDEEQGWDEDEEGHNDVSYGFRRKHMLQRRREKERQRIMEEERLARIEREQAEKDRKAREMERAKLEQQQREREEAEEDYPDATAPLGMDDSGSPASASLFLALFFTLFLARI